MLKGFMNITSDPKFCFEFSQNTPNTKIISLDEDNSFMELSPSYNANVIMGSILLPTTEAQWAEIDGDIQSYNSLYYMHLSSEPVAEFINTLIGFVYLGGNIIFYCPDFDASGLDNSKYIEFIMNYLESAYGIHLGTTPQDTFRYDITCIPMYYIGIYTMNIIDAITFIREYPIDAMIPDEIYYKIILDTDIYGENLKEKIDYINLLRRNMRDGKPRMFLRSIN